jgi:uncharacterized membrane protein YqjE
MNEPSGIDPSVTATSAARPPHPAPPDWKNAISGLVSSRLAIFQVESQEVGKTAVKKVIALVVAAVCLLFAWGLILAGGIAAIATSLVIDWYWIAFIAAVLHLIVAVILVTNAKSSAGEFFPVTRSEFKKDREWIENFQNRKK